jgi:hypothetical protein
MRVSASVDYVPCHPLRRLVYPVHQNALYVRLERLDFDAQPLGFLAYFGIDVFEFGAPIDLGFATAQQIQIGAMQNADPHFFRL